MDKELILKELENEGFEVPSVFRLAIKEYREDVRRNKSLTADMCELKIIRNWNLGNTFYKDNVIEKRAYGNLAITMNRKTNTITRILNRRWEIKNRNNEKVDTYKNIDLELKEKLNKVIGV